MADMSGEIKAWLSGPALKYNLTGKIGGAFATADYITQAIQNILNYMLILSMLTHSSGAMFGAPVIHLGPVAIKGEIEHSLNTFTIYGERFAKKVLEFFN